MQRTAAIVVSTRSPPHLKKFHGEMKKVCLQKNDDNSGASVVSSDTPVVIRGYPEVNHDNSHEKEMPASVDELHCKCSDESDANPKVSTLSSSSPQGGLLTREICIDSDGEEMPALVDELHCDCSDESDVNPEVSTLSSRSPQGGPLTQEVCIDSDGEEVQP